MPRAMESPPPVPRTPAADPAATAGDAAALQRFAAPLRRYLRVLGCAADRIDDVVQDAFVVLLRRGFAWRGDAAALAFLRQTARHLFLQQVRSDAARREVAAAEIVWRERCADDGDGYIAALRDCVAALPADRRRLVEGAYRDDLSRDELARTLGLRPAGIKTALRRVRARLRACVERKRGPR